MSNVHALNPRPVEDDCPADGTRRKFDGVERVHYCGYWIKTYPVPADTIGAKRRLIEALTRRLFNHTEHGLNIPGNRLNDARQSYDAETDPARKRVKAAMLAGTLFNRATDIFKKLVDLQADGIEVGPDDALMKECGQCLHDAMELGRFVLHRSGEEGIDELWSEPLRAFSVPLVDFYESRYVKIGHSMRDIDRIAEAMVSTLSGIGAFENAETPVRDFALAAKAKMESLRSEPAIFDIWARLVTSAERLTHLAPMPKAVPGGAWPRHSFSDGQQLIRNGRDLIFYIAQARTPMPKSTREFIERCERYLETGRVELLPGSLPA